MTSNRPPIVEGTTNQERAAELLAYWEVHGNDPAVVAKWAVSDLLGFLRFVAEGD